MRGATDKAAAWIYRGVWARVVAWLRVAEEPPTLPHAPGEPIEAFRPARGFLSYLRTKFWIALAVVDGLLTVVWLAILVGKPVLGLALLPVYLFIAIVPDIIAYIAIHLRYDTTWYVFSDRSLRIRRGVWIVQEDTITFENVQNVSVKQGPLQRYFGIADLVVETAGGGGGSKSGEGGSLLTHGVIEGVDDAPRLRDMIMDKVRQSRSAGLGDERDDETPRAASAGAWTPAHIEALREIRDEALALAAQ